MEHSIPAVDLVRPWRTATLLAAGIAALELVLLLTIAFIAFAPPLSGRSDDHAVAPAPRVRAEPAPQSSRPALPRADTSVLVLNGNGRAGAAAAEAVEVRSHGYVIGGVGNAPRSDYTRTIVMYRPGYRGEGMRLARDLGVETAAPLDGLRLPDLMGAHLAVVLGS